MAKSKATTGNEWNKASQLGDSYWLYVVWDPLNNPDPEPLRIQNPVKHLDHVKREVVAARHYDIPAEAISRAAEGGIVRIICCFVVGCVDQPNWKIRP